MCETRCKNIHTTESGKISLLINHLWWPFVCWSYGKLALCLDNGSLVEVRGFIKCFGKSNYPIMLYFL